MKPLVAVVSFVAVLLLASAWGEGGRPGDIAALAHAQDTGGKIAFTSDRDGNSEIYVMNADGSDQTNLTNNPAEESGLAWSPDGSRIAFASNRDGNGEIYVMNADGSGATNFTNNAAEDSAPAWSPDGTRIAFTSFRGGNLEIYVMNADGSGQTSLTIGGPFRVAFAGSVWSPDGTGIAYTSQSGNRSSAISVVNADGSDVRQLSRVASPIFNTSPAWSPDGSRIAFVESTGAIFDPDADEFDFSTVSPQTILVMNADGSDVTGLTDFSAQDSAPVWSPDGSLIAFVKTGGLVDPDTGEIDASTVTPPTIYVMNADGSNQISLTDISAEDSAPAWSPDGSGIAFQSDRDGNSEIYIMNADGSGQTNLTSNAASDTEPVWSPQAIAEPAPTLEPVEPDASAAGKIAFTSHRDGNGEIYVMNEDGSDQTNLTNNPALRDRFPTWSPDGSRIAFSSDRDLDVEIYVMNADGSDQTNLTNNPAGDFGPVWSPEDSRIAFISDRDGHLRIFEIYVMNADGSGQTRLTNQSGTTTDPTWSPDGARIAFQSDGEIYVMNSDGSSQTRLTDNPAIDGVISSPAWSPDGTQIAFNSSRDGNSEIYIMNADGSNQKNLTDNPATDVDPDWSPDGSRIAFSSFRDGNSEIYVMNADGSDPTRLTDNADSDTEPVWSPGLVEPQAEEDTTRSDFVKSVPAPDEISLEPDVVGFSLFLTLFIIVMFGFTSALFNQTLASNREEIEGWTGKFFAPLQGLSNFVEGRFGEAVEGQPWIEAAAGPAAIVALTGLIYGFLSPDFGLNASSVGLFLSLAVAVGAITYVFAGGEAQFTRRRFGLRAGVKLYPVAVVIAVVFVLMSRLMDFQPGFMFGFVAAFALLAPAYLDRRQDGQGALFPVVALLAVGLIAWFLMIPLREVAQTSDTWVAAVPEATAASLFVGALEGVFFSMIPLSFMHGARVAKWNRLVWLLAFAVPGFLFVHVLLNQDGTFLEPVEGRRVWTTLALVTVLTVITTATWLFFAVRANGWSLRSPGILEFARRWGGRPIARLVLGAGAIAAVVTIIVFAVLSGDGDVDDVVTSPIVEGSPTATVTPNLTPEDTATPTPAGETDMIAFRSDRDGNLEIYVMNADGSDPKRLTNNGVDDFVGSWSPDGHQIVFSSGGAGNSEIYVMNADGSGQTNLTNNPASDLAPAWSPDGTQIAFVSDRDGDDDIYVINLDGSGLSNLTKNDNITDGDPAWSPDGSRIAFQSDRDGNFEIFVMNADGSDLKQLTDSTTVDRAPAWSPDGGSIAFDSNRDGNFEIYVMDDGGSFVSRLTEDAGNDGAAAWSPDGSRIAFTSDRGGNFEVYVMNADGSHVIHLTNNQALDAGSEWSPAP